MTNLFTFISNSSLFIALCACSLSFFYSKMTGSEINFYRLTVIFLGTWASYIGVQLIPIQKNKAASARSLWIKKQKIILYSIVAACFFGIFASIRFLENFDLLNFSHLFILVLFYEKIFFNEKELRKIPYIKPFLISYIWACVATAPQIFLTLNAPIFHIWPECFLFILALTIPFDIRDMESDHIDGVKTLATKFQIKHIKVLCFFIFILAIIYQFSYLSFSYKNIFISLGLILFYLLLLSKVWPNQKDALFLYGLDGMIILKLLYLI
jgi:4-hydroxybenzoate polyprenyltransferase